MEVSRKADFRTAEAVTLGNLGLAALLDRRPAEALRLFGQALDIDEELASPEGLIYDLAGIAAALSETDEAADAALLLGAADTAAQATAIELEPLEAEIHTQVVKGLRTRLGAEQFAQAYARGQALSLENAVEHGRRAAESRDTATGTAQP
jgi:hypothetical protein